MGVETMDAEPGTTVGRVDEATPPVRRIPPVAEALGYAGGALALAALVTLVFEFRGVLGVWGQAGISAIVAVAGFVGGLLIERLDEPAAKRLGQFLLFLGVAAVGCAVGFVAQEIALQRLLVVKPVDEAHSKAAEWAWFAGMLAVALSGGVVWWKRRTWLQHLAFGTGVGMATLLLLPLLPVDGPEWGAGLTLSIVGVIWGALTLRGWLPPENAGITLASLGILGGIELMALSAPTAPDSGPLGWAVWLGIAASLALVAGGAWLRRYVALGVGATGLVVFAIQLVTGVLHIGMGTPIAFLIAGLTLLAAAAWLSLRFASAERPGARILAEIAGYAGVAFSAAGCITLLSEYWEQTSTAVHIAVPAILTVVAYGCALVVERANTDSSHRLSQVLYGGGIAAVGASAAMIVYPIALKILGPLEAHPDYRPYLDASSWSTLAAAVTAMVVGAVTWLLRRGVITEVATGIGVWVTVLAGTGLLWEPPFWLAGSLLVTIGLVWTVLGVLEIVRPSDTGVAVGCLTWLFGMVQLFADQGGDNQLWAPILGMCLAVAAIAASIWLKRGILLAFGAVGVVIFAFAWTQMVFEGEIAGTIALLVAGVLFIAMAVLVAFMLPRFRRDAHKAGDQEPPVGPQAGEVA